MTIKLHTIVLAVTAALLVGMSSARAAKPLDVDCDLLAATNAAVDAFLDGQVLPPNTRATASSNGLGDLVVGSILDDDFFDFLDALILFFSGGAIDFESGSQAVATNAKCGLIPQLINEIRD